MHLLRLAPLALLASAGGAAAQEEVPGALLANHVVVDKSARTLTAYADGTPLRVIEGIQLGDAPDGPKRFQGDERTPEGRYEIDWGNPQSAYTLSLHVSYPNAADTAYAASFGRSAGGMIMIHGQPTGMAGRMRGDWTDGCIAVSNEEIAWLWQVVPDGATIDILP
ncbi:L,D-transpeptidase family protein [Novosphingobium aquimarinum]|uniref:L,D-transpeptidase family protein n=1 Tax=Novosphingobium aquimarinum TaxID=2682494 RepID=UPI0012EBA749|nr:L,D-transpeptidase family protein [Novosphingobium aquimarinum]